MEHSAAEAQNTGAKVTEVAVFNAKAARYMDSRGLLDVQPVHLEETFAASEAAGGTQSAKALKNSAKKQEQPGPREKARSCT